jgi:hypothetical protein
MQMYLCKTCGCWFSDDRGWIVSAGGGWLALRCDTCDPRGERARRSAARRRERVLARKGRPVPVRAANDPDDTMARCVERDTAWRDWICVRFKRDLERELAADMLIEIWNDRDQQEWCDAWRDASMVTIWVVFDRLRRKLNIPWVHDPRGFAAVDVNAMVVAARPEDARPIIGALMSRREFDRLRRDAARRDAQEIIGEED